MSFGRHSSCFCFYSILKYRYRSNCARVHVPCAVVALLLWKDLQRSALMVVAGVALLLGLMSCSFVWLAGALGLVALVAGIVNRVWHAIRGSNG